MAARRVNARIANTDGRRNAVADSSLFGTAQSAPAVFWIFWLLVYLGCILVKGPWAGFHGILFAAIGLLMAFFPPACRLPKWAWLMAGLSLAAALGGFAPAEWFGIPEWRVELEGLGLDTGSMVSIQPWLSAEAWGVFVLTLLTGLWLAGHRPSSLQARWLALAFALGVASYALFAKWLLPDAGSEHPPASEIYGFFPNRNHTGTYLAMGSICGLGCALQAIRDKSFLRTLTALTASGICLWAIVFWSISRGGLLLVAAGCLTWLSMLGRHYLGTHARRAVVLAAIAIIGGFLLADSTAKQRLSETFARAQTGFLPDDSAAIGETPEKRIQHIDFRVSAALDTLNLIRNFPWTGVGPGQFSYIHPQYRQRTLIANDSDLLHPENDWLWMAAETGLPATVLLAALILAAGRTAAAAIRRGRDQALRSACLVAAMLVPLHGLIDVPGHRIPLSLAAVLLFVLSLRMSDSEPFPVVSSRAWIFRTAALLPLAAAAWLTRSEWFGGSPPAHQAAHIVTTRALERLEQDRLARSAAEALGKPHNPPPREDPLELSLAELRQLTRSPLPLHRTAHHLIGRLALHFDDKDDLARRSFAIERKLDPTWIGAPLRQAWCWSNVAPEECARLWAEALALAARIDATQPGAAPPTAVEVTTERIRQQIRANPKLQSAWENHSPSRVR
jgi:O-antigen ligase